VAGQGSIPANRRIDARTTLDLSAEYDVTANASLFASVENLTDKVYNVAFSPAGARPGLPRTLLGGVKLRF
jgi:Fe(3+) dicitrate transport protein